MCLALHVNSWFLITDIEHLIKPRIKSKVKYEGNFKGYNGLIVPTKIPKHAVVSTETIESTRMHFFLHDEERFRNCVWDGEVSYGDKKDIVTSVVKWLNQTDYSIEHLLYDYEDGSVFTEVIEELDLGPLF